MKRKISLTLLCLCLGSLSFAMSFDALKKVFFDEPEHFKGSRDTNTVVSQEQSRGHAQETRPDISVPPPAGQTTGPEDTLLNTQKLDHLISDLEKIATTAPVDENALPDQPHRPQNSSQKLRWLPPPPGFMTADTFNYLIYREQEPVSQKLKTVLDDIHGNLMLDLTPFTIVLKPNKILVMLFDQRQSYMNYTKRPSWSGASSDLRSDSLYVVEETGFYPLTVHELTHLYFDGYFLPTISPLWLSEGMAVYMQIYASKKKPIWINTSLQRILLNNEILPFEEMVQIETLTDYPTAKAELFYTQAYSVVDYLLNKRTRDEFYRFCNELKAGTPVHQALYRAYGMPFNKVSALQNVWLHDLQKAYQAGKLDISVPTPQAPVSQVEQINAALKQQKGAN